MIEVDYNPSDDYWKSCVREYARSGRGADIRNILYQSIVNYLWQTVPTYQRLAETDEGKFVRELANVCPDMVLRAMYREKLRDAK